MHATIIQTRRFVLACLAAIVVSGFTAVTVYAQCSNYTVDNRECTDTEQHGYCLTLAWDSYQDCLEAGGFLWDLAVCGSALDLDIVSCTVQFVGNIMIPN